MYINLARHFALFIFLFIGSFVLNAIQADAQVSTGAPRLEQLTKDVKPSSGISSSWAQNLQRIACADVSGEILNVTFSLEGGSGSAQAGVFAAGDPNIIHAFNYSPIYVTDVLPVIGGKRDYSFTFTSPVDLSVICPNPSTYFYLTMKATSGGFYRYGSNNATAYRDSFYGSTGSFSENIGPADWYFIINGTAQVNHPPVLSLSETATINEGSRFQITPTATDKDGGTLTVTAGALPSGAVFSGGTLSWTPRFDQEGTYQVELTVIDDGNQSLFPVQTNTSLITITVQDTQPELQRLEQLIKDVKPSSGVSSGWAQNLQRIACADVSGEILNVTFSLEGGGSGSAQAGVFAAGDSNVIHAFNYVPVYVTDILPVTGAKKDYNFTFTSPVDLSFICPNPSTYFYLTIKATSGGFYRYGSNSIAAYRDSFYGSTGSFGSNIGPADWYFIINEYIQINAAPTLTSIGAKTVDESSVLGFTVSATDPDNDPIAYSATNLPVGATLNPTTGEFTWTTDFNEAGTYQVTFTATENTPEALSDSETVTITVLNTNRPPELTTIGNQTISEGGILQFTVLASDSDNDPVVLSANNLPTGATFTPSTGTFYWNTNFDDAGNYPDIEFTATDNGTPMELDVELITITVGNVNRMPEITNPGPQQVLEGDSLSFSVSATDPDNDTVTLSATNLPSGATFNPLNGIFSWTPSLSDAGVYTVTVTATDNGTPTESASTEVVITVGDNPTPTEQAEDLIEEVVNIDIPQNVENSYLANLQKVGQFILEGKITAALNQLNAFLNKVQQDYNQNILTQEEYESLTEAAENLIDDLTN